MATRIRLRRTGKKKQAYYRVVVADSRSPRDGRFIEVLGTYNPNTDPAQVTIDEERALYWLKTGALPSDTVRSLFGRTGLMARLAEERPEHALLKKPAAKKKAKAAAPAPEAPAPEAPAPEAPAPEAPPADETGAAPEDGEVREDG